MAAATSISANLSLTVAHAITFLTRPLISSYPETAIIKLRSVLQANLTTHFAHLWAVNHPTRRGITLSPHCLPPSVIYSACLAAGVQWFDWISLLGGREFDLFIDPGCVSVRRGSNHTHEKQLITVWSEKPAFAAPAVRPSAHRAMQTPTARPKPQTKTLAQQLLEVDHEDDEKLFAMITDEVTSPMWINPNRMQPFPPFRSSSPAHSRSSSRSSDSSSGFSLSSAVSSGSVTSMSTSSSPAFYDKQSHRERARQTRVIVDTSKTEVTPYDGGKTTVLTGGVMLGGASGTIKLNTGPKPVMRPVSYSRFVRP